MAAANTSASESMSSLVIDGCAFSSDSVFGKGSIWQGNVGRSRIPYGVLAADGIEDFEHVATNRLRGVLELDNDIRPSRSNQGRVKLALVISLKRSYDLRQR
jgi:hypothetical protein